MSGGGLNLSQRKIDYFRRSTSLLHDFTKILVVTVDNVGSSHMQGIRKSLRGQATLLMGKNTLMRKAMREYAKENPQIEPLIPHLHGNVGLVLVNGDLHEVKKKLLTNIVGAYAKIGSVSPCDVIVPKGDTGMDPSKTAFFQALSIQTKINKGKIEIINDINLMRIGDKVSSSQAALLQMLNIKPFNYGCKIQIVYDNGQCFHPSILELTDSDILERFQRGVQRVTSVSLATGLPTVSSVPHIVSNAYRKLIAVALSSNYSFKEIDSIKKLLDDPEALKRLQSAAAATSAPAAGGGAAKAAAAAEEEKKDELSDDGGGGGMGGLFGDDEEF